MRYFQYLCSFESTDVLPLLDEMLTETLYVQKLSPKSDIEDSRVQKILDESLVVTLLVFFLIKSGFFISYYYPPTLSSIAQIDKTWNYWILQTIYYVVSDKSGCIYWVILFISFAKFFAEQATWRLNVAILVRPKWSSLPALNLFQMMNYFGESIWQSEITHWIRLIKLESRFGNISRMCTLLEKALRANPLSRVKLF